MASRPQDSRGASREKSIYFMKIQEIKTALAELGAKPNKHLGQHFLVDKHALDTIVQEAEIEKGDHVLEVGPGLGVLTRRLIEAGAEVIAIERDKKFAAYLRTRFSDDFECAEGDAAKMDWDELIGKGDWKFVSNLPYGITAIALRKALWGKNPPTNMVVLIQREVAERIILRGRKKHSLLSLMVAFASHETQLVKRVSRTCFYPPPRVESAILRIIPTRREEREVIWGEDPEKIMALARKGFAHPRKFLFSNLDIKGEAVSRISLETKIPEKARAEDLKPEDWVLLAKILER